MLNKDRLKKIEIQDKTILANVIASFGVKGFSLILSFFTMPIYIRFFHDQAVLGVWYTLLSIMNWVLFFDLGLGNGLRNKLPKCLIDNDTNKAKGYIASTYFSVVGLVLAWAIVGFIIIYNVSWNRVLNIDESLLSISVIRQCILIVFLGILIQFVTKLVTSILYAIQLSAVVSLLTLITTAITLILVCISPSKDAAANLIRMSWINVVAVNLPYLIATFFAFATKLKKYIPSLKDFSTNLAKEIMNVGVVLLWLTLVFMVISYTNEFLISFFTDSSKVVEYQAYNKLFNAISSLFTLALAPIWSAVTKALAEKKYSWIKRINQRLLLIGAIVFTFEILLVPFLQNFINLWLGENYIQVDSKVAVIFVISNTIYYIHNVNTSIGNGVSYFKTQLIWVTFAAIVDIPLAWIFVNITGSWIGVIVANIIALIPFELLEVININRFLEKKIIHANGDSI